MVNYTLRRLILAIPVLVGILVVTFFLQRASPGDPCTSILGEKATVEACERFNTLNGFDKPLVNCFSVDKPYVFTASTCAVNPIDTQFFFYMGQVLQGNFGDSTR